MGYTMANDRWADTESLNLSPLEGAAVTVDGYSAVHELGDRAVARLVLDTTSVSSGDVVDVTIETSRDGSTFYTSGTFTQVTAASTARKCFMLDRFVRAKFDVTGSGVSIALTLTGEAS